MLFGREPATKALYTETEPVITAATSPHSPLEDKISGNCCPLNRIKLANEKKEKKEEERVSLV